MCPYMYSIQKDDVNKPHVTTATPAVAAAPVPSRPPQMNRQAMAASQLSPASGEPDAGLESSPGDREEEGEHNGGCG